MRSFNTERWRFLRTVFAISGIVQGFFWLLMSVLCIVLFYKRTDAVDRFSNNMINEETTVFDLISFCLYDTILDKNSNDNDRILIPGNFFIIAWLYAGISLLWLCLSIYECTVLYGKLPFLHHSTCTSTILALTSAFTIMATSILDAIVFFLALDDYLQINPFEYSLMASCKNETPCDIDAYVDLQYRYRIGRKASFAMVMCLASRGFLLWCFNCFVGCWTMWMGFKIIQTPRIMQFVEPIPRPQVTIKNLENHPDTYNDALKVWNYKNQPPVPYKITYDDQPKFMHERHRYSNSSKY